MVYSMVIYTFSVELVPSHLKIHLLLLKYVVTKHQDTRIFQILVWKFVFEVLTIHRQWTLERSEKNHSYRFNRKKMCFHTGCNSVFRSAMWWCVGSSVGAITHLFSRQLRSSFLEVPIHVDTGDRHRIIAEKFILHLHTNLRIKPDKV